MVILKSINPFHANVLFIYPPPPPPRGSMEIGYRNGGIGGIGIGRWREKSSTEKSTEKSNRKIPPANAQEAILQSSE